MDIKYAKYLLLKTKKDYNLIGRDFSRTRGFPWPELKFLFDKYILKGDKVLDLGCGNGRFYSFFKRAEYFGIDSSRNLIKIAKKKYPKANFLLADALNLPFPDNYFDKVFSIAVFHHIPSKHFRIRFLKEARRVLKRNGIFVLTVWKIRYSFLFMIKNIFLKIFKKSKLDIGDIFIPWGQERKRYYHLFSKKELSNLIKEAGLKIIERGTIKNKKRNNIYVVALSP